MRPSLGRLYIIFDGGQACKAEMIAKYIDENHPLD